MPCKAVRINKATVFYVTVHPLDRLVRKNKQCAHNPIRELLRGKQRGLGQRRTGTETTRARGTTCGKDPATDTFRFPQPRPQRQAGTTHLPAPECSEKYAQEAGKKL